MNDLRVLCVDDQRAFAEALAIALDAEEGIDVVGIARDVAQTLELLETAGVDVDVVVMDLDLPTVDGIEGTRRVLHAHPEVRVVILTGVGDVATHARAVAAGASCYLDKTVDIDELVEALRSSHAGPGELSNDDIIDLRDQVAPVVEDGQTLTDREREVLALLAAGVDADDIAAQLHIRPYTCRGYIRNVHLKLGVHSQLEAVAEARRRGLLSGVHR